MTEDQIKIIKDMHGPESRNERLQRLLSMDDAMDIMCSFVASGGTLVHFARLWDIRYPDIMKWIRSDSIRAKRYDDAIKDRNEYTIETILQELRDIALFDIRDLYDNNNNLKPVHQWPRHTASVVSSVETDEIFEGRGEEREMIGLTKKIKLWDKLKAIEQLGKTQALFVDRVEETRTIKLEDLVLASYKNEKISTDKT